VRRVTIFVSCIASRGRLVQAAIDMFFGVRTCPPPWGMQANRDPERYLSVGGYVSEVPSDVCCVASHMNGRWVFGTEAQGMADPPGETLPWRIGPALIRGKPVASPEVR